VIVTGLSEHFKLNCAMIHVLILVPYKLFVCLFVYITSFFTFFRLYFFYLCCLSNMKGVHSAKSCSQGYHLGSTAQPDLRYDRTSDSSEEGWLNKL